MVTLLQADGLTEGRDVRVISALVKKGRESDSCLGDNGGRFVRTQYERPYACGLQIREGKDLLRSCGIR